MSVKRICKPVDILYHKNVDCTCNETGVSDLRFNPRSLGGGGGGVKLTPLNFFGFKFLLLDRLSKALAQLFLVCKHIF